MSSLPPEADGAQQAVPKPDLPLGSAWFKDPASLAAQEEAGWEDLDKVKVNNDRNWLKVYGRIVITITIVFTGIFLLSLLAWSSHYLLPEKCFWLSEKQLGKIQSILFSGGMGAVISTVIKRQMDRLSSSR